MSTGWDAMLAQVEATTAEEAVGYENGLLAREWVVPPFSVLDTTQGYWRERRRRWLALGIESELGRGEMGHGATDVSPQLLQRNPGMGAHAAHRREADTHSNLTGAAELPAYADFGTTLVAPGTSIFDPVLCECCYRWWCPPGGTILDPFAGGSVRGIVAAMMGHPYTGIDLSAAQVEANREQAARILPPDRPQPRWYVGDSREVIPDLPAGLLYDMVFTCPPYYDLEVYSHEPADLSAMPTYAQFVEAYGAIIEAAVGRLRMGRMAAIVVSDVRAKQGHYIGLRRDTEALFERAGARKYNEAVLVNAIGTLAMRAMKQMVASRKLGRMHQDVLVFARGEIRTHEWEHGREAPPDPQQALGLLQEPEEPVQEVLLAVPTQIEEEPTPQPVAEAPPEPEWAYTLTPEEVAYCEALAQQVIDTRDAQGHRERGNPPPASRLDRGANGFAGEMAVARLLGDATWRPQLITEWRREVDLPSGVEVRTRVRHHYDLWLCLDDRPSTPYVLVTGTRSERMVARGWVLASEGMVPEYAAHPQGREPGYFVPQAALHPMASLPRLHAEDSSATGLDEAHLDGAPSAGEPAVEEMPSEPIPVPAPSVEVVQALLPERVPAPLSPVAGPRPRSTSLVIRPALDVGRGQCEQCGEEVERGHEHPPFVAPEQADALFRAQVWDPADATPEDGAAMREAGLWPEEGA